MLPEIENNLKKINKDIIKNKNESVKKLYRYFFY